jgi:hypothetical protein
MSLPSSSAPKPAHASINHLNKSENFKTCFLIAICRKSSITFIGCAHPSHVLKASYSMRKMLNCTVPGAITAISSAANISGTITVISAATNMRV